MRGVDMLSWIAFGLGVVTVALVVRRSVWNYPFGIAMVTAYAVIFAREHLYSDALLQGFFLVANIAGWAMWSRNRQRRGTIIVEIMTRGARLRWFAAWGVMTAGWGWAMARFTDAHFPWWDAGIAIASVIAQILMVRRRLENWAVWIAVDIGSIGLYAAKALWLTMLLYAVFLALAVAGHVGWARVLRDQEGNGG